MCSMRCDESLKYHPVLQRKMEWWRDFGLSCSLYKGYDVPHLCRHEYCQPEHINPDKYDTGRIRYHSKEGTEMIAIRPRNQNDYIHIPYSVYKQIKEEDL